MKLWLDAQLSPEMASWIVRNFSIEAVPVRDVGLKRCLGYADLRGETKRAAVVLITKDSDFYINLFVQFRLSTTNYLASLWEYF